MMLLAFVLCLPLLILTDHAFAWMASSSAGVRSSPRMLAKVHSRSRSSTFLQSTAPITTGTGGITLDGQEIRGPITPLGNLVLVKVKETLTATTGGILLPDQAKERPTEGLVIEAGPGKLHPFTGVRITNPIKPGMSVLYGKYDGKPVEYNGDECQMIRDDDVLLYYEGVTMKLDTVIPCRDYVLVALDEAKQLKTNTGVVLAAQVMKDAEPCEGVVVKCGEGRMASNGEFTPCPVEPGDKIKYKDYAGNRVMIEGKPYSVVKMVNILCTYQEIDQNDVLETEQDA